MFVHIVTNADYCLHTLFQEWKKQYLHPDYEKVLDTNYTFAEVYVIKYLMKNKLYISKIKIKYCALFAVPENNEMNSYLI